MKNGNTKISKSEHGNNTDYYYDSYREFSWKFRLWLIAYGVSIPVIVISNKSLLDLIKCDKYGQLWIMLTLLGVFIQVFLTWAFKICMWYCDRHVKGAISSESNKYKISVWISEHYIIEILIDIVTLLLFTVSTYQLIKLVLP